MGLGSRCQLSEWCWRLLRTLMERLLQLLGSQEAEDSEAEAAEHPVLDGKLAHRGCHAIAGGQEVPQDADEGNRCEEIDHPLHSCSPFRTWLMGYRLIDKNESRFSLRRVFR